MLPTSSLSWQSFQENNGSPACSRAPGNACPFPSPPGSIVFPQTVGKAKPAITAERLVRQPAAKFNALAEEGQRQSNRRQWKKHPEIRRFKKLFFCHGSSFGELKIDQLQVVVIQQRVILCGRGLKIDWAVSPIQTTALSYLTNNFCGGSCQPGASKIRW